MQFTSIALTLLTLTTSTLSIPLQSATTATPVTVSYDEKYDVAGSSLNTVSCSDGVNGLIVKGFSTFSSLPTFPLIGGAPTVAGWNSPNCGKCYELSYNGQSVTVLAVDAAPGGFNLALEAMNALTNGQAQQLGRIDASYTEIEASACGL